MKLSFTLLIFILFAEAGFSQEGDSQVVSPAGASFEGKDAQLDWTLGEPATLTIRHDSRQITQGFHQPNFQITSLREFPASIGAINVLPNPTSGRMDMQFSLHQAETISIRLFDFQGRTLWQKDVAGTIFTETTNISALPAATYLLNFSVKGTPFSQTLRIQKIK
ncbi:T9SS type A sorting domain-containing protein [Lewinella sp. W8]|uniref:T9SS type A sorting domain-containing protein n=1 Tax=Lewinella sp. W8 TaxID=2528208 RepID=UPI0010678C93|nr:T9SS type A sorting domain-containing protein [Lewinella sp. W8]MTB53179.1 T9SS type A sorting domain-containing protein [Lewinella sp. W8]